jgi:DNA-binding NarL/FixJ family response regulator
MAPLLQRESENQPILILNCEAHEGAHPRFSSSPKERAAMKVYGVDDSAVVREPLISMLSEMKDTEMIEEGGDAAEAFQFIQQNDPDVVILGLRMPRGGGMGLLKKLGKSARIPVTVVLTNYPYPHYRKKCLEAGAKFFLDKSTEFSKIPGIPEKVQGRISAGKRGAVGQPSWRKKPTFPKKEVHHGASKI